jgi:hypothetical protein
MRPFDSKKSFITMKAGTPIKFRGGFTEFEGKKGSFTEYSIVASG